MLKPKELADYLQGKIPYKYYANEFTSSSPDDAAFVRLTGGLAPSDWSPKKQPSIQVIVRGNSNNAKTTEDIAYRIYDFLHLKTEFRVGSQLVRRCKADQSSPLYIGRDENGRLLYSINFTLVVMS